MKRQLPSSERPLDKKSRADPLTIALQPPAMGVALLEPTSASPQYISHLQQRSYPPGNAEEALGEGRWRPVYRGLLRHMLVSTMNHPNLQRLHRSELLATRLGFSYSEYTPKSISLADWRTDQTPDEHKLLVAVQVLRAVRRCSQYQILMGNLDIQILVPLAPQQPPLAQVYLERPVMDDRMGTTRSRKQNSFVCRRQLLRLFATASEQDRPSRLASLTATPGVSVKWTGLRQQVAVFLNSMVETGGALLDAFESRPLFRSASQAVDGFYPEPPFRAPTFASVPETAVIVSPWDVANWMQHFWAAWEDNFWHRVAGTHIQLDTYYSCHFRHLWLGAWNFHHWIQYLAQHRIQTAHRVLPIYEAAWMFLTWLIIYGDPIPDNFFPELATRGFSRQAILAAVVEILDHGSGTVLLTSPFDASGRYEPSEELYGYALLSSGSVVGDVVSDMKSASVWLDEGVYRNTPEAQRWRRILSFLFVPMSERLLYARRGRGDDIPLSSPVIRASHLNAMGEAHGHVPLRLFDKNGMVATRYLPGVFGLSLAEFQGHPSPPFVASRADKPTGLVRWTDRDRRSVALGEEDKSRSVSDRAPAGLPGALQLAGGAVAIAPAAAVPVIPGVAHAGGGRDRPVAGHAAMAAVDSDITASMAQLKLEEGQDGCVVC